MKNELLNNDKLTIDELFQRSKKYKSSKEFFRFFNFISRFDHYSRFNAMLIYLQDPTVQFFGGTNFWLKNFKRTVKEDARPYVVLQPFAPVMLVYDIFETEGEETPDELLEKGLGRKPFEVLGRIDPLLLHEAFKTAKELGINVTIKPLSYFNGGYVTTIFSGTLEIALKEGMSPEEKLRVFIHELGHLFLGHTGHVSLFHPPGKDGKRKEIKLPSRRFSKSVHELEAETISFLICKKLGLETRAAEYLSGYINSGKDLEDFSHEVVIKTVDKIESLFFKNWMSF